MIRDVPLLWISVPRCVFCVCFCMLFVEESAGVLRGTSAVSNSFSFVQKKIRARTMWMADG